MRRIVISLTFLILAIKVSGQSEIDSTKLTPSDSDIFNKVEVEASFPGGDHAWREFLMKNLNANVPVKKKAPAGKYQVIVKFIVSKKGEISSVVAETNHGYGMEKEVIKVIKKGPKWIPAYMDGKPVNAYRRQPVTFVVSNE
jgi:periplasmic protein TonB